MEGHFSVRLRRFARDGEGAAMIEFAFIFPVMLMITFGIMEISLCMASLVTLEGGLKQASRYGITSQTQDTLTADQLAKVPTYFKDPTNPRLEMIGLILNENTLDLIDLNEARPTAKIFSSFSAIKDGEPYNDKNGNGQYDADYDNGVDADGKPLPKGEPYSDLDCDGQRDGPGSESESVGAPGNIVVYTVDYDWRILTPIIGRWLGEPDPNHPGGYRIPMTASIVVKNEPNLSGSSFCKTS
jgi:Flp pilus assembly pilin Flp